ncbi:MAG: recombination mediator RecR [Planctomycetaceae bacterium]|nr:recombination mediator RecR [Planctomycetaceae bacterium]
MAAKRSPSSSAKASVSAASVLGTRSSAYPAPVERLIEAFAGLPGIGRRSAERLALHVLKASTDEALGLARAVEDVKLKVRHCQRCFNLADAQRTPAAEEDAGHAAKGPLLCRVCADPGRDHGVILVVEQPKDLLALEQTGMYQGVYHVLLGRISPLEGVGPGDLTIGALIERVRSGGGGGGQGGAPVVREVILGLNPTLEGDGTALYLREQLAGLGVKVSQLARGLAVGSTLEFASKAVLAAAIAERRGVEG